MTRPPDPTLPSCPTHPGSSVRKEGTTGRDKRVRLRCFYRDPTGEVKKHGFTPALNDAGFGRVSLPHSEYSVEEVSNALLDLSRGMTYTEAARRARLGRRGRDWEGKRKDSTVENGQTVANWLSRYGTVIIDAFAETEWPQTVVLDSTEFLWTNPRGAGTEQLFAVLCAWGYPEGAKRGRLWAVAAVPSDSGAAWSGFLASLPGEPTLVIWDDDWAIASAVRKTWPRARLHLCEHHLYRNAADNLHKDGQGARGNVYRGLLNKAAQSPDDWYRFRDAVQAGGLRATTAWVRYWDKQMQQQTAWRPNIPAHYSTGALDPQIAVIRQHLERRRWTFRNRDRMNLLLGLMRLHINRLDSPVAWTKVLRHHIEQAGGRLHAVDHSSPATITADGFTAYSLRKHPVPPADDSA